MAKAKLEVGDFVKVIKTPNSDANERFIGKRAIVMKIYDNNEEGGPIGVVFAPWYKYLFDAFLLKQPANTNPWNVVTRFNEEELEADKPWDLTDPEYGAYYFEKLTGFQSKEGLPSLVTKVFPFLPGICNCMVENCEKKAILRIFYRDCGPAYEAYVCSEHASFNGVWTEFFPRKKNYEPFEILELD